MEVKSMQDLLFGKNYKHCLMLLSSGERYYLTFSRLVLFRPFLLFWLVFTVLFMIQAPPVILIGILLPVLFFYILFAMVFRRLWTGSGYHRVTYVIFHILVLIVLKITAYFLSYPAGRMIELLYLPR